MPRTSAPPRTIVEDLLRQVDDFYRLPADGDADQWADAADHWSKLPQSDRDLAALHVALLQLVAQGRLGQRLDRLVRRLDELVELVEEAIDGDAPEESAEEEPTPNEAPVEEEPPPPPPSSPSRRKPTKAASVVAEVVEPPPAAAKADTSTFPHPVR